ncbi:MAG: sigma 54-interacting transcriptional regulator [Myxococcales bacterium]|nr:sigma 54-interacting transcriptional regulator [Myxococcales bacterium]
MVIGRGHGTDLALEDERLSREHARVAFVAGRFRITDCGSRNGTFVDGRRIEGTVDADEPRTLRVGHSLLLFERDLTPFMGVGVETHGHTVVGPRLGAAFRAIDLAARAGDTLSLVGESGVGKELGARRFHDAGARARGPFVPVNCAAIPASIAERLLFGVRRGAYSGADGDADGYVQAAHGGTLFLDEIAELEPAIQAKLLRVVETHEVLALGATRAREVTFGVVCAGQRPLGEAVAARRFREDLFYRIGRPEVAIPALRDRAEDIPWLAHLIARAVRPDLTPHPLLVEAALLRPWPGNVRELVAELRRACHAAVASGATVATEVHLDARAGLPVAPAAPPEVEPSERRFPDEEVVDAALRAEQGNVSGAARRLGLHRNQLRRWLQSHPRPAPQPTHEGDDSGAEGPSRPGYPGPRQSDG